MNPRNEPVVREVPSVSDCTSRCEACQPALAAGAQFCPHCGMALASSDSERPETETLEANCAPAPPVQLLEAGDAQSLQPDHGSSASSSPPVNQPVRCQCGCIPPENARFCPDCARPTDESSAAHFYLEIIESEGQTRSVPIDRDEITIGNADECDLRFADDSFVSRRHARIVTDDGLVFIEDLGSSNGTLLRVRRPLALEVGDELLIGTGVIRLAKRTCSSQENQDVGHDEDRAACARSIRD